jgi:hypothetical protein
MAGFSIFGRLAEKAKFKKRYSQGRPKTTAINPPNGTYNTSRPTPIPAPVQAPPTLPPAPTKFSMAGEVAKCSALLREMYALDLVIYGMEENVDDEAPERIRKQTKANAMFVEIRKMVNGWRTNQGAWSPEERDFIEEICEEVERHQGRAYPEEAQAQGYRY